MINKILIADENVTDKIYVIRNQRVMLDSDIAELYDIETRILNQAVNRNLDRFPIDFMFQLNDDEWPSLISQNETSKKGRGGRRKIPFVFTEHGILMLSSVLNSDRAIQINIQLVRIFTRLRKMFNSQTELRLEIETIKQELNNQGRNVEIVFAYLDELSKKTDQPETNSPRKRIGYKPESDL
jgi:phage regulator Rha-like protein